MLGLGTVGFLLYFLYPVILISFSIYWSRNREVTVNTYFFANQDTNWPTLGISLLSASLFGPYVFGLVTGGSAAGAPVLYAVVSIIMLVALGRFFAPKYLQAGVRTLPELFEKRFDRKCRRLLSSLYIVSNIAIRLLLILTLGRILLSSVDGADVFSSLLFFVVVTGIYVIVGGLQDRNASEPRSGNDHRSRYRRVSCVGYKSGKFLRGDQPDYFSV